MPLRHDLHLPAGVTSLLPRLPYPSVIFKVNLPSACSLQTPPDLHCKQVVSLQSLLGQLSLAGAQLHEVISAGRAGQAPAAGTACARQGRAC